MEKIKQNKGIVLAVLALVMVLFYWTEVRPSSIKSECSWFNEVTEADPGVTPEQASENKKTFTQRCPSEQSSSNYTDLSPLSCYRLRKDMVERPAQPRKEEIRDATKEEYQSCLRHSGF